MPQPEKFYYADGRKIPIEADPNRVAVRYREEPAGATRDIAALEERISVEQSTGAVSRVVLRRQNMVILAYESAGAVRGEQVAPAPMALAARDDVEFVTPVYREMTQDLQLVPTDEFNVRFKPDVTAAQIAEFNQRNQVAVVRQSEWSSQEYTLRITDPAARDVIDVANTYYESHLTEWAEPNFLTEIRKVFLPNDPLLTNQWHLENTGQGGGTVGEDVHAQEAWDITTGDPSVVIAIIDDGVDASHPDLAANIQPGGYDFFDNDNDANPHYFAPPYNVTDVNDIHGTPCAGVAAACGNNNTGVAGIAYRCRILPVKVWGSPNLAPLADVAAAIRYAAARAAVLSSSWTCSTSDTVRQAIQDVTAGARGGLGVLALFAAGNSNGAVGFPARLDASIAVGASTNQAQRASYSCHGPELDLAAPSSGGTRGIWTTDVSTANRGYNLGSAAAGGADGLYTNAFGGTSSATPLAAGVAALILSVRPDLSAALARRALEESCDHIGPTAYVNGRNDDFGHGRVNAQAAVEMARAAPIGNARTRELHHASCTWVSRMASHNKRYFLTAQEGIAAGYNGCYYCLHAFDTG